MGNRKEVKSVLVGVASRLGFRKNGLKSLGQEVSTCEYEDVRIMWDMLMNASEDAATCTSSDTKKKRKQQQMGQGQAKHVWELFGGRSASSSAS